MKKLFNFALTALCLLASSIVLSCSDDDDPVLRVDNEVIKGIKADVFDNIYKFNVESSGDWTASLPENCDWARLMKEQGRGRSTVEILVDGNNTGIDRKTVINVVSGNLKIEVPLEQTSSLGEAALNEDENHLILAGKKYLGYGCNLMEFMDAPDKVQLKYTVCNIINSQAISSLMDNDDYGIYSGLANTNELELTDYEDARLDTIIKKKDELGIHLSIQVAYGVMKFGLKGDYTGNEELKSNYVEIHTAANYPVLEATVNYAEVLSHYEAWQKDKKPKDDYRRGIVSLSFANLADSLKKHCSENNEEAKEKDIRHIIESFGTGVITQSKLGGVIALELLVDSIFIKEKYDLQEASVTGTIQAGGFTLDAEVKVKYIDDAREIYQNSRHRVKILGGDRKKSGSITKLFEHSNYGTDLATAITDWAESIDYSNKKAQLISFEAVPIWYLFQDEASQKAIIDYFKKNYSDSKFVKEYLPDAEKK